MREERRRRQCSRRKTRGMKALPSTSDQRGSLRQSEEGKDRKDQITHPLDEKPDNARSSPDLHPLHPLRRLHHTKQAESAPMHRRPDLQGFLQEEEKANHHYQKKQKRMMTRMRMMMTRRMRQEGQVEEANERESSQHHLFRRLANGSDVHFSSHCLCFCCCLCEMKQFRVMVMLMQQQLKNNQMISLHDIQYEIEKVHDNDDDGDDDCCDYHCCWHHRDRNEIEVLKKDENEWMAEWEEVWDNSPCHQQRKPLLPGSESQRSTTTLYYDQKEIDPKNVAQECKQ